MVTSLIPMVYAAILTMAPATRNHAGLETFQFQHWISVAVWFFCFTILHQLSINQLPNRDPYLLPTIGALSGIGLLSIWRLYPGFGIRQTIWLALGCIVVAIGLIFPVYIEYLRRYKYIFLVLGLILTIMTIFWGYNPLERAQPFGYGYLGSISNLQNP